MQSLGVLHSASVCPLSRAFPAQIRRISPSFSFSLCAIFAVSCSTVFSAKTSRMMLLALLHPHVLQRLATGTHDGEGLGRVLYEHVCGDTSRLLTSPLGSRSTRAGDDDDRTPAAHRAPKAVGAPRGEADPVSRSMMLATLYCAGEATPTTSSPMRRGGGCFSGNALDNCDATCRATTEDSLLQTKRAAE